MRKALLQPLYAGSRRRQYRHILKPGFGPFFALNDRCKQRQGGALEYLTDRYPQGSLPDLLSDH